MSDDLMKRLCSLYKQATVERSHFYVGSCAKDAMHRIEELEAESKTLRSMVADVIADTGDDPEIMAASRAEWAARAFTAEAKLAKAVGALVGMVGLFSADSLLLKGMHLNMELDNARAALAELKGQE
jgi:predicted transcriptional regulator